MVLVDDAVEDATQAIARALVDRAERAEPPLPDATFWDERLLEFCMRHPELKAQLFRFIDVLPALPRGQVAAHLLEYLGHARADLPAAIRWGVEMTSAEGNLARVVGWSARRNVQRMARRFIAGSNVGELVTTIEGLRAKKLAVTLDVLGEAVLTEEEADAYRDIYLGLLREIPRAISRLREEPLVDRDHDGTRLPRVNLSVKLSALTSIFDPIDPDGVARAVIPRFRAILDAAAVAGAFVHVDMEQYERKDLTLSIFEEVLGSAPYRNTSNVGIVLQAYLKDTEDDIRRLGDWARRRGKSVWIRLVKGAYWDSETVLARQQGWPVPVWEEKWQTDACYERCIDLLLDRADCLRPAFASHNVRSLARALAAARARDLPPRFIEFQALYGMADPMKAALASLDQRVRVYAPFGQLIPGMAYLVRRLLENTSNESFVRHELAAGDALDAGLRAPSAPTRERVETAIMPDMSEVAPRLPFENEPLRDFSRAEVRDRFRAALARVSTETGIHCPVVIAGREMDTAERILSVCPWDPSRVLAASASATVEQADLAVVAARDGFAAWRGVPVSERAAVIERAAELFVARRDELSAWVCLEAGKTWRDADADIAEAIDFCRYYAAEMRALGLLERVEIPGEDNVTVYAPRGPTAVISPWNFPVAILTGMTVAALVTGNPVILKPAEQTPACAYHVFRLLLEAGVPATALHFLPGVGEVVGARLVEHPEVATIAFTGSRDVGHLILRRAAETSTGSVGIKHVIAEMGGKNAIIVDDDADLDEAVPGVLASAFGYAGQKCSAASRVIVQARVYDEFLARLTQAAGALLVGPADDPAVSIGPLIDEASVRRIARYVELGARDGRIVFRGQLGPATERGYFAAAVIVADVSKDSALAQEEIFAPLLVVLRAASFGDALAIANGTPYALTGGLYSRSPDHIARARRDFDVGNLYINRKITGALVARQPFGGHRHSGTGGKAGGRGYLHHFVVERTITENTLRRGFAPESGASSGPAK